METGRKFKLFISYSHEDESHIEKFKRHIVLLKNNGLIEEWYDRKILPGEDYQSKIDNKLEDADIICLFISANFLSSENCRKEKKKAIELRNKKRTVVLPVILSPCGWLDDKDISKLLALPKDGKAITEFENTDKGWVNVYEGLKKIIENEIKIMNLKIKEEFEKFLQDTEILSKAHPQKETILLDDIFIHPELDEYDNSREFKETISSQKVIDNFHDYKKIVIAGEDQSGKTTLCKVIFRELRKRNFIPVYVFDKEHKLSGLTENRISKAYQQQYEAPSFDEIYQECQERIVPVIDDFHLATHKEKHIIALSKYSFCVLIVDDIFSLNIKDEKLISLFTYFRIKEMKPSLRYELIRKWVNLKDPGRKEIELYKQIDQNWEIVEQALGKAFGKGIMPSYPFFVLSALVAYGTSKPLNQEITSLGYCYQALIYYYLKKRDVKDDEIDIYVNLLTEFAYYLYKEKKIGLSIYEIDNFFDYYKTKFILPIEKEKILSKLDPIVTIDSFGNYSFSYPYIYYFFVSKYLSENMNSEEVKRTIENIIANLHVDENAYITIFLIHHTKDIKILEEIKSNAMRLFGKYKPATLSKSEVKFFDEQADIIIKASLPPPNPEKTRHNILEIQDKEEENNKEEEISEKEDPLEIDLRRAIKTAEVMGIILKNRGGSLEKTRVEELFEEAINIHLRVLSSFFEIIKDEEAQKSVIEFISNLLEKFISEKDKKLSKEELEKEARHIFWNLNFFVVYSFINKAAHSLGSDKLIEIIENVDKKVNTPASFLIKEQILMWYLKNLKIDEITKKLEEKDFSQIGKRVMSLMVARYFALHPISYKDRQKIETKLGISTKKILFSSYKKDE